MPLFLLLFAVFSVSATEADLKFASRPSGWTIQAQGVRVLRAKGPNGQTFQAVRGNPTNSPDLRKEAEGRWENFFITELISGDSVFLNKPSLASGVVEGLLLCKGRRYELKGRVQNSSILLGLMGTLRCGSFKPTAKSDGPLRTAAPPTVSETRSGFEEPKKKIRSRLRSYAVADILAEPSGESLLGKNREAVMAARPYLQLRNYWNLGPMRIEELREFVEGPIPGTRNYVFEGWGEPKLVRVIFEFKNEPSEKFSARIKEATDRNAGDSEPLMQPYTLKEEGVDDGVIARIKRLGSGLEGYAQAEKKKVDTGTIRELFFPSTPPDVLVWRGGKPQYWFGNAQAGMGTPGLRSIVFIRESYHLVLLFGAFTLVLWLLLYWTPLLDSLPQPLQKTATALMGMASCALWVIYPLASFGWFFYEIQRAGYL